MKQIIKSLYQNSRNKEVIELILNAFNNDCLARYSVAESSNIPVSILEFLSNDENDCVRSFVAENLNTPIPILERLSEDEKDWVRCYVARNKNTPAYILDKLSNDKESIVRLCVIKNLNDKKSINKISFLDYLKDLFYNLFKKKKRE